MIVVKNNRPCFIIIEGVDLRPGVNKLDDVTGETLLKTPEYARQAAAGNFSEIRHEAVAAALHVSDGKDVKSIDFDLVNLVLDSKVGEAEELISALVAQTDQDTLAEITRAETQHKGRKAILEAVARQLVALSKAGLQSDDDMVDDDEMSEE